MIFLDTSYFVALALHRDALHEKAAAWSGYLPGPFITTEYILLELVNLLSTPRNRAKAHQLISRIRDNPQIQIISGGTELFHSGLSLHAERADKSWSLTDCISFIIMQRENVVDALTNDHHFEQAGFKALLRQQIPH